MQAIATKYLGPTNRLGGRVKASADAGNITVGWDHRIGVQDNHIAAAKALAAKLDWNGRWIGGSFAHNGNVYVLDTEDTRDSFYI